jgi:DNA-binding GntR family transcriptional regulator
MQLQVQYAVYVAVLGSLPSTTAATRPSRRVVTEWVIARLYELIFGGEIAAGQQLVEGEITELLGVSRTPVHEALMQLERDGIVKASHVSGRRVVAAFGLEDIREIYTIRAALEGVAHAEAAERMTPEALATLAGIQAEMEAADPSTPEGRANQFDADFRFHELVSHIAALPRLQRELSGLWRQTRLLLYQLDAHDIYPREEEELLAPRADYRATLGALGSGDRAKAASTVRRHFENRRDALLEAVKQRGDLS